MDSGVFHRSRGGFAAWLLIPIALALAIALPPRMALDHIKIESAQRAAKLKQFPEMVQKNEAAQAALSRFARLPAAPGEGVDSLTAWIGRAAKKAGVTIHSMNAEKTKSGSPKLVAFSASLTGEGPLAALADFVTELQGPENILQIGSARIKPSASAPDSVYEVAMSLMFYSLEETAGAPAASGRGGGGR